VRIRALRVEIESFVQQLLGDGSVLFDSGIRVKNADSNQSRSEPNPGVGRSWIKLQGPLERLASLVQRLRRLRLKAPVPAAPDQILRIWAHCFGLFDAAEGVAR
jgi:hypothetical protein